MATGYEVYDARTGKAVATARTMGHAYDKAERRNQEWGAVRYAVRPKQGD